MLQELARVFVCLAVGEAVSRLGLLPFPGPVVGLVLLYAGLIIGGRLPDELGKLANAVLSMLGMLFVPAGVGVLAYLDLLRIELVPIAAALLGGTVVTALVTAYTADRLAGPRTGGGSPKPREAPLGHADSSLLRTVAAQPAVGVAATVLAYLVAVWLNRRCGGHPCLNPTLVAIMILATGIRAAGLDYATYAQSASVVSFLLAPAVVMLAVPLFRHRVLVLESGWIVAGALGVGLPTGVLSAVGIAWLLGADHQTLLSLAPKSTTAGIAIGISQAIGGLPALTAVLVIMTGIIGAVTAPLVARSVGVRDHRAVGLAMGIASHGIGTARALQISEVAGAFAGLGMGLNGVLTAIVLPLTLRLF